MKNRKSSRTTLWLVFLVLIAVSLQAADLKWLRYGNYQAKVVSTADMGEGGLGWAQSGYTSYNGFGTFNYESFNGSLWASHAWYLITKDWEDDTGTNWPVKMTGCGQWNSDEIYTVMPVVDDGGYQISTYVRYQPPLVTVDGTIVSDTYPFDGADYVAADGDLPGTVYAMLESKATTDMGVDIHQRVYSWSHNEHDDYLIYDWTFTNTGNIDRDAEIELPDQDLDSLYFFRMERWGDEGWASAYGESPGDSLRIVYGYPNTSLDGTHDSFGEPHYPGTGFLQRPVSTGVSMIHLPESWDNPVDAPDQPNMWATVDSDLPPFLLAPRAMAPANWQVAYEACRDGYANYPNQALLEYEGQYPGRHKSQRFDELGYIHPQDHVHPVTDLAQNWAAGPYSLPFGESIRFVVAFAVGFLSPETAWEVGRAWSAGDAHNQWPESSWPDGEYGLPAQFDSPRVAANANDLAKDAMVYSGVDTLFRNAAFAKWNFENDLEVPIPPAAPSLTVTSRSNYILVEWGNESETIAPDNVDFAGYRIYRAEGNPDPILQNDTLLGSWQLLYECVDGDCPDAIESETLTYGYKDESAVRGTAYFYYVAAYDDGTGNGQDADGSIGKPLESGKYMNRTTLPANLTRPPGGNFSGIRVVPNPYNYNARTIQFPGEDNKIMFYDVPPYCDIKIFSESGDLIKTLHHTDGSGDQVWGLVDQENSHSTSETGQGIVSGIYIAYIEVTDDYTDPDSGEKLFTKGESTTVKFLIVR